MKLDYYLVDNSYRYYSKLKHLYEHAFPPIERPPFNYLMSLSTHEMYAVELDSTFVGLFDLVIYQDTAYLFFLAIKKTYRHKHIGTEILQYVSEKYKDYRIYLLAEDIDGSYPNIEERKARLEFYKKNGFTVSNHKVNEFDVVYNILYRNEEVDKNTFLDSMKYLLGEDRYYSYYIKYVK